MLKEENRSLEGVGFWGIEAVLNGNPLSKFVDYIKGWGVGLFDNSSAKGSFDIGLF